MATKAKVERRSKKQTPNRSPRSAIGNLRSEISKRKTDWGEVWVEIEDYLAPLLGLKPGELRAGEALGPG